MRMRSCLLVFSLVVVGPSGCEAVSSMVGMAKVAGELGKHLQDDLGAPLTDDKIDKVVEVTPALREFSEKSEHKWELDADAPDFTKFASAMGAMSDYIAFFETHDTRLTEYYVDMVKISDARAILELEKAHDEALAKHDKERDELKQKLESAQGDDKNKVRDELKRNKKAKKLLEESYRDGIKAREDARKQGGNAYKLSEDEIALVEKRLEEVRAALDQKKKAADSK